VGLVSDETSESQSAWTALVTERIRRGTQLYEALTADLKSHAIRPEAAEIEDLFRAIEHLYEELKHLN
jgi:hypothetical protein